MSSEIGMSKYLSCCRLLNW